MTIRTRQVRALARRGEPGDLDLVVHACRDELAGRVAADVGDTWIGITREDLALAHLDRARFGRFDATVRVPDATGDVADAAELADLELTRRSRTLGPCDVSTSRARELRAYVVLCGGDPGSGRFSRRCATVLTTADQLIASAWDRTGCPNLMTLRGQLLRVEGLLAIDRDADARQEARLAGVLARRYPGWTHTCALLALARASARLDRPAAVDAARQALAVRLATLSPTGHPVAQARALVAELAADPAGCPR